MLVLDGRDHADRGRQDVRGIEPAAQTDLDDGLIDVLVGEPIERERGRDLEERRGLR